MSNYATEKQRNYINVLFGDIEKNSEGLSSETDEAATEMLQPILPKIISLKKGGEISKAEANTVITTLKELQTFIEQSSGIIHCRWKKTGNDWFVVGPENIVTPGATVTVKSSKGEKEVEIDTVAQVLDGKAYGVPKKPEVPDNVSEGIWRNDKEQLIEVYKTRKGFLVGKLIDEETAEKTYLGKAGLSGLKTKLSLAEAKEWGKKTGYCCACGKELTKKESIEAGIGPVCANKGYW